jgi:hypothetical protein
VQKLILNPEPHQSSSTHNPRSAPKKP